MRNRTVRFHRNPMPAQSVIQTNFTAGELSPRLLGRTDLDKYQNGAATIRNFTVLKHGGVTKRMGTKHITTTKSDGKVRLVPFQYSTTQTYMLEFGAGYIRVYRDSGQLLESGTSNPMEVDTSASTASYTEDDLAKLNFAQSADVLFIVHPDYPPHELQRLAGSDDLAANWKWTPYDFKDGPYEDLNTDEDKTIKPLVVASGEVTIRASVGIFASTDVGRLVALEQAGSDDKIHRGYGKIISITESTTTLPTHDLIIEVVADFQTTTAVSTWRIGSWSDTTGWPRSVSFHQNRVWFGGSTKSPQTLWASATNDFANFRPNSPDDTSTTADTDGLNFTISDNRVNTIHNIRSEVRGILVLTNGGEFVGMADGLFKPITPTNFAIARHGYYGSPEGVQVIQAADRVLFVQSAARRIRELGYSFESDRYQGLDLSILSDHLTEDRFTSLSYQQERESIIWGTTTTGTLLGMTYERPEKVFAWHQHILGGSLYGDQTVAESIGVIREENEDQLWVVAKRLVNGVISRSVEIMKEPFRTTDNIEDAFYLDAALTLDNRKSIAAVNQTMPVTVTTFGDHGASTGDTVLIRYVEGMTELNDNVYYVMDASGEAMGLGKTAAFPISAITRANPAVVTAIGHGFVTGDKVFITGVSDMTQVNGEFFTITRVDTDTFSLDNIDSSGYTVFVAGTPATATVTITAYAELNTGDKVNLVATDGTNYDFTNGDQSSVAGTWESTTSNNQTASNLMNVINTSSGPAGTRFTATVDGAVVTITQATAGADGNTTITLTDSGTAGMTRTNFTGGEIAGTAQSVEDGRSFNAFTGGGKVGKRVTAITGLTHLVGETVGACGDGADLGTYTVASDGTITLLSASSIVHVGLPDTSEIKTMPLIFSSRSGDTRGYKVRAYKTLIRLFRSIGGKAGFGDRIDEIDYRVPSDDMNMPPDLFTGMKDVGVTISSNRDAQVTIQHSGPQPMTILAIHSEVDIGGV